MTHPNIEPIWNALHGFRETNIPEGTPEYDEQWDDICTAMAQLCEAAGLPTGADAEPEAARPQTIHQHAGKVNFNWRVRDDGSVYIEDLCNELGGMSVTNGAEYVLAEIARHIDLSGRVVVYKDSEGQVDQIIHHNGRFAGFRSGYPLTKS